ncbi:hypothetical protein X975_10063, partial [Stegodyphus mimosarum]
MLFGHDLRLPCDALFSRPSDVTSSPEEYIQDLLDRFEVMRSFARERVNLATDKMKTDTTPELQNIVSKKETRWGCVIRPVEKYFQLQSPWNGPYTVLNRLNDVVVRIRDCNQKGRWTPTPFLNPF